MTRRADDNGPFKEFSFEEWFCGGWHEFREEMRHNRGFVRKESFRKHMRTAIKEQLMAVRDVIDGIIDELDQPNNETNQA